MNTTVMLPDRPEAAGGRRHASLLPNVLGRGGAIVMAVAGSAPAYTLAASTASLTAAVALAGPAALLWCGIPMLGVAWAFAYLGRGETNAGASYAWVARAIHPVIGYLCGWSLIVAALVFMVTGSLPAGSVTLGLFSSSLASNTALVTLVGSLWFLMMALMVFFGVRITARAQWIMSSVEIAILLLFAILCLVHAHHVSVTRFSWSWFSPTAFHGTAGFAAGALVAAFYYWGWDVASNLNEETKQSRRLPGLGGIVGVVIVFSLYEIFTIASQLTLTGKTISANAADILAVLGQAAWPGVGGKFLAVAVMLSTIATLETTIIQVTRSLFAMGRDSTLPPSLARVHPRWRTPWVAVLVSAFISLALFALSNSVGSVGNILTDTISAIGLQIAFYYGFAALAVPIAFRKRLFRSPKSLFFAGILPVVSAAFMFYIFVKAIPGLNATELGLGLGLLGAGVVPMAIAWSRGSTYFRRPFFVSFDDLEAEQDHASPDPAVVG
jgi:amino acid transporter